MGRTNYRHYISTAVIPTTGVIATKTVLTAPAEETEAQRSKRLKAQAAANRIRVTDNHDGTYTVTGQLHGAGVEREEYTVAPAGATWLCQCKWHQYHPGDKCAHVEQVKAHRRRKGQSEYPVVETPKVKRARTEWTEEV